MFLLAESVRVSISSHLHQHWVLIAFIFSLSVLLPFYVMLGHGISSPHLEPGRQDGKASC